MSTSRFFPCVLLAVVVASCGTSRTDEHAPTTVSRLSELRARFASLGSSSRAHAGARVTATVYLATRADQPTRLVDDGSSLAIAFSLRGATNASATTTNDLTLFAGAAFGSDLVHRVHAEGLEDFVAFESRPLVEELRYDVDVTRAPGLRLVGNTLEFIDETGAPRLRVAPPFLVDGAARRHHAQLFVEDCAYDASPVGPWGRPVTSPGASRCTVRVAWGRALSSPEEITYPALLDPAWTATGSMTMRRDRHTATLLASGRVLATGGEDATVVTSTAELFDPAGTGTFAATGSMSAPRQDHTATALASGKALITGGFDGVTYRADAEVYVPATGTFVPTGPLAAMRQHHTASLLGSGKVLVTGGESDSGIELASAELYDPAGTGTFASAGAMTVTRAYHDAVVLLSGKVLLVGGEGGGNETAELYDPVVGSFVATGSMNTSRRRTFGAARLASGKVLVAGGISMPFSVGTLEIYDPASEKFSAAGSLADPGAVIAETLSLGKVLLVAERPQIFDVASQTLSTTATPLVVANSSYGTALLASGKVLLTGGGDGSSAQVFNFLDGNACKVSADCGSGSCTDGVCCSAPYAGPCEACDVPGSIGLCTAIGTGAPHGARAACAGNAGSACGGACTLASRTSCTFASTTTPCGTTCAISTETVSTCDGRGGCTLTSSRKCPDDFACESAARCRIACAADDECAMGFACIGGHCKASGATCSDEHTSTKSSGEVTECSPYKCTTSGLCGEKCSSVDDCAAPNLCSEASQCVAPAGADDSGCAIASRGRPRDAPGGERLALAFVALAVVVVRRSGRARAR